MSTLPLFSYPMKVVLIDDDPLLLEALTGLLKTDYPILQFGNPAAATRFFTDYQPLLPNLKFLRGCTELENYDVAGQQPADINLQETDDLRNHPHRSEEVAVIIIDYNMPDMNGIDFCRQLKSLPAKKILLTGEVSDQRAIAAFNEGVIDCFIRKDSLSLAHDIRCYLKILTQKYLAQHTQQLLQHLEIKNPLPASDPEFAAFFREWCHTHRIKEYFIADHNSNFLLIDENGQQSYFVTHTDHTLDQFVAAHEEDSNAKQYINAVANREKIPFFWGYKESWDLDYSEWDKCFRIPQIFIGRETYYWMVFEDFSLFANKL